MFRNFREKFVRAVQDATNAQAERHADEIAELRREITELRAVVAQQSGALAPAVGEALYSAQRNMRHASERKATAESAQFVQQHMSTARELGSPSQTLEHALSLAPQGGMALEFGVYTGSTLEVIAKLRDDKPVYGFDSFDGLPEEWRAGFPAGTFATDDLPRIPGAELVVGIFDDTLEGFLASHPGQVDFLHVDCDLYSSTETVLTLVGPRLHKGSVVVFDEYFNYPGWSDHEHKAWLEYVERTGTEFSYVGYTIDNEQVIVQL